MKIYKYPLEVENIQELEVPGSFQFLHLDTQEDKICVWGFVDPHDISLYTYRIHCFGTGQDIKPSVNLKRRNHLGTIQQHGFVWHFFIEEKPIRIN